MAESNEFVQSSFLSFSEGLHLAVREVFHPSRDSKSSSMIGHLSSEEDALDQTCNQDSCSGFHSLTQELRSISLLLQKERTMGSEEVQLLEIASFFHLKP